MSELAIKLSVSEDDAPQEWQTS